MDVTTLSLLPRETLPAYRRASCVVPDLALLLSPADRQPDAPLGPPLHLLGGDEGLDATSFYCGEPHWPDQAF
ncbi:MAG: hypothetical protein H0W95_00025 [Nocardioidaceae bacterium]|nr:hypothetical protein [Nocardioidaceae bacterium]